MEYPENQNILNNYINYCLEIIYKTPIKKRNNIETITFKKSLVPACDKQFIRFLEHTHLHIYQTYIYMM